MTMNAWESEAAKSVFLGTASQKYAPTNGVY